jgi:hypothetical protein
MLETTGWTMMLAQKPTGVKASLIYESTQETKGFTANQAENVLFLVHCPVPVVVGSAHLSVPRVPVAMEDYHGTRPGYSDAPPTTEIPNSPEIIETFTGSPVNSPTKGLLWRHLRIWLSKKKRRNRNKQHRIRFAEPTQINRGHIKFICSIKWMMLTVRAHSN